MERKAKIHHLKTVQPYFNDIVSGKKNFEVRKNDRDFKVGDILVLFECIDGKKTGRYIGQEITYVLNNEEYCKEGYVVLGIQHETVFVDTAEHIEIELDKEMKRIGIK